MKTMLLKQSLIVGEPLTVCALKSRQFEWLFVYQGPKSARTKGTFYRGTNNVFRVRLGKNFEKHD
jgi:hypothetical protein